MQTDEASNRCCVAGCCMTVHPCKIGGLHGGVIVEPVLGRNESAHNGIFLVWRYLVRQLRHHLGYLPAIWCVPGFESQPCSTSGFLLLCTLGDSRWWVSATHLKHLRMSSQLWPRHNHCSHLRKEPLAGRLILSLCLSNKHSGELGCF